jgi:hypothetical protein
VPAEQRTDEQILREIAAEREQLATALADLRAGVYEKRRLAAALGGAAASVLAALAALSLARRLRS